MDDQQHENQYIPRLLKWIDGHGGATECLVNAGYERGSKSLRNLASTISQYKGGSLRAMTREGAETWEDRFASSGMPAGYITDGMSKTSDGDQPVKEAPSELIHDYTSHYLREIPGLLPIASSIYVRLERDMSPVALSGSDLLIDPASVLPINGCLVLAQRSSGDCELGIVQATVDGFDLDCGNVTLERGRHGLRILGTAIFALRRLG
jgi:hypothetical protein